MYTYDHAVTEDESKVLEELTRLAVRLQEPLELEAVLEAAAESTARVTGVERASVRLLEHDGTLAATARAGSPVHVHSESKWKLGEGLLGWVARQQEVLRLADAPSDSRFVPRPDMTVPIRSFIGVPIVRTPICVGVLSASHSDPDRFDARHEAAAVLLAAICAPYIEVARLARLSTADPLTGLLNRRGVDSLLGQIDEEELRKLSVIMADVDHFKKVNDSHGHSVGDGVLRVVAGKLAEVVRESDAVARYGGEEFLMVLPGATQQQATRIAERARDAVSKEPIRSGSLEVSVTVSFGVAQWRPGESRESLIARADAALYEAKDAGRDQVVIADE